MEHVICLIFTVVSTVVVLGVFAGMILVSIGD